MVSDPTAEAYKDWFHLNVFLPESGHVALINMSLHGPPWDSRSRAVGVALMSDPDGDWIGGIEIADFAARKVEPQAMFLSTMSMAVTRDGNALHAKVDRPDDGFKADIVAQPVPPGGGLDISAKFGSGWIGWNAVPVLKLSGTMVIDGENISLDRAMGYHDHNWGRWFWGEDVAWEWGAFSLSDDITVVVARGTDKQHFERQPPHVFLVRNKRVYGFTANQVSLTLDTEPSKTRRRLPGALAAIHPDRRSPDVPQRVILRGDGPSARFELSFKAHTIAQLLLAEPMRPGAGFINEVTGTCTLSAQLDQELVRAEGVGVFEYVE